MAGTGHLLVPKSPSSRRGPASAPAESCTGQHPFTCPRSPRVWGMSVSLPFPRASVSLHTQFGIRDAPHREGSELLGANSGGVGLQHPQVGGQGFGRPSPWFGAAATSMLGNFMLIRENKEGAGSRGGGHAWGRWPHHPQRQGM